MSELLTGRIALTLAHFLWQGLLIAVFVWLVSAMLRGKSANARYAVLLAGLITMAACAMVTFAVMRVETRIAPAVHAPPSGKQDDLPGAFEQPSIAQSNVPAIRRRPSRTSGEARAPSPKTHPAALLTLWQTAAPFVVAAYLAGVAVLLARLMLGLRGGWNLRRQSEPLDDARLLSLLAGRVQALGMRVTPALCRCGDIAVPTVVGILRPAILLPASLMSGLSPAAVETILTHELAHISRRDHLVNVLQRIIEAALFFHPAVWWISRRLRVERENCCDDVVLRLGAEPVRYAELLVDMAEQSQRSRSAGGAPLVAALHAAAGRSQVEQRVRRLLGMPANDTFRLSRGGLVGVLFFSALLLFATVALRAVPHESGTTGRTDAAAAAKTPRETVQRFLRLIKSDSSREAWKLTAPDSHAGWGPELTGLREFNRIRPLHQANTDKQAVVVSNLFQDNSGRTQVFYAMLRKHRGKWLLERHSIMTPDNAASVMQGFTVHPDVRFDVLPAELVGRWFVNVCQCSLSLAADGTGEELPEGPGGPEPGAKPIPFKWRVKGDTLTRQIGNREETLTIQWVDDRSVRLISPSDRSVQRWDRVGRRKPPAVHGVQFGIVPDKRLWNGDEIPTFTISLRHRGAGQLFLATHSLCDCFVEVDGQRYRRGRMQAGEGEVSYYHSSQAIAEAHRGGELPKLVGGAWPPRIPLDGGWVTLEERLKDTTPLRLTPGTHTVRFEWTGYLPDAREQRSEKSVQLISAPVTIEVADSPDGVLATQALETADRVDDPLGRILQIDTKQVAHRAHATQQDAAVVSRACGLVGLNKQERAAIAKLASKGRLGALDFDKIEQIERFAGSLPEDRSAADFTERWNRAFDALVGFTPAERKLFDGLMQRTGRRTVTIWKLARQGKLSQQETAVATKLKQMATVFFVNHATIQGVPQKTAFTPEESRAVRKLGKAIERRFQELFFSFFSC